MAWADEGMWLPEQVPALASQYPQLDVDPNELADPKGSILGSVVSLGGCSGSFVSDTGLIITNHHCVEGYLQSISDEKNNRWRDGFTATSQETEAPTGPAGRVWITLSQEEVTTQVLENITKRTKDAARASLLEQNKKALIAKCEAAADDLRCWVASFDGGANFRLIERRQLNDLRVVWAPPRSVGQFGGDIDNWEWPRHGFDTALLRVYVAPDGSSAQYSEDNVPFKPEHHLAMSPGVKEGDLTMVAGYPGRTQRHRLAAELQEDIEQDWGRYVEYADRISPILERHAKTSESASARLGPSISGLGNGRKNRVGVLEGIQRSNGLQKMQEKEAALLEWIRSDRKRKRTYEPIYTALTQAIAASRQASEQDRYAYRIMWASDLLGVASTAVRWATEQQKPDEKRDMGYQSRDQKNIVRRFDRMEQSLYLPAEKELLVDAFTQYLGGSRQQKWASIDQWMAQHETAEAAVLALYGSETPTLATAEARRALIDQDLRTLQTSQDPFVTLALALETTLVAKRKASKERGAQIQRLRAKWSEAEKNFALETQQMRAPDANSTLRLTFGHVMGYTPEDGLVATPFTTLPGLVAKAGTFPFDAPEDIVSAARLGTKSSWAVPSLGNVPIDFLADLDTTGGNSGSPCLDASGRLAGLLFDGVWESVANDYVYDTDTNRSIVADIRGTGWLLSQSEHSGWILKEMGLNPNGSATTPGD